MTNQVKKKAGRKPLGDKAMTRNERMQKTNDARRARGVRSFLLHVEPQHLKWIEQSAEANGATVAATLKELLAMSLDRYAALWERVEFIGGDCSKPEAAAQFFLDHLQPPLPSWKEVTDQFGPTTKTNRE